MPAAPNSDSIASRMLSSSSTTSTLVPSPIVITAHDSPAMRKEVARLGAAAYLPKPFEGNVLLTAIKDVTTPAGAK